VRQEKIGALKWLVIGVAVAFGVAYAADYVISYFAEKAEVTMPDPGAGSTRLFF
jgi:hypothetical protein